MKARSLHSILRIGALALGGLQGCGTRLEMGSPPRVDRLAQLKPHVSTKQDVLLTLGEPHGVGREFLPFLDHPRTVWSYYFEESQASLSGVGEYRRIFVWVFLDDERYDGYLWVSNFPGDRTAIEPGRK